MSRPIELAWNGGKSLAVNPYLHSVMVTKQEYEEHGSNYTYKKFNSTSLMKKKPAVEVTEEPKTESPYAHLYGEGPLINQIQKHGDLHKQITRRARAILKESGIDVNVPPEVVRVDSAVNNWNDSYLQREEKTSITGSTNWQINDEKLKLKFW